MKNTSRFLVASTFFASLGLSAGDTGFGEPLPADGGAPFAAYQEHLQAVHSADWDAFKRTTSADEVRTAIAEAGDEQAAKADFVEMAEFLAMMTPVAAEFVQGRADDQRAHFWARVTIKSQAGTEAQLDRDIEMVHADGLWVLENESPR